MSTYREIVDTRFGGILSGGKHDPDGAACALEAVAVTRGVTWTDSPQRTKMPDIRPLNDAAWSSDAVRTEHMVPLIEAYWDWASWTPARRKQVMQAVALRTIQEILPIALRAAGLDADATACESATDLTAARAAYTAANADAYAAYAAAAYNAAYNAAYAARAAAYNADAANADDVLILACRIWIEEATRA